jgi:hypothetical protein
VAFPDEPTRRTLLMSSLVLPLAAGASASALTVDAVQHAASTILVAYFSRSGNTPVIAGKIHRARGADLFEIEGSRAYPEDYFETVEQSEGQAYL